MAGQEHAKKRRARRNARGLYITLIAVANEPARVRVRRMFADVEGAPPRVVVHPPWFVAE